MLAYPGPVDPVTLTALALGAAAAGAGRRVAVQDQDFGQVAAAHPDRELTDRIMDGVAARIYPEPYSGRRLPGLLRGAGLERVRLLTDVYQDTALAPFSKSFLERRAENAVRFGLVTPATAQAWLDGFTALVAGGAFVLTIEEARAGLEASPFVHVATSATMLGNVGPSLGFAGPMGSMDPYSPFSKSVMILLMWAGRLEIIPVAVLLTRRYWRA